MEALGPQGLKKNCVVARRGGRVVESVESNKTRFADVSNNLLPQFGYTGLVVDVVALVAWKDSWGFGPFSFRGTTNWRSNARRGRSLQRRAPIAGARSTKLKNVERILACERRSTDPLTEKAKLG